MQDFSKDIFSAALAGVVLTLTTTVLSLILYAMYFRFMDISIVGLWLILVSVGAYINLMDFGLSPTLSREIGFVYGNKELSDEEKQEKIVGIVQNSGRVYFCIAIIVFSLGAIFASQLDVGIEEPESFRLAVVFFVAGSSIGLLGNAAVAGLYGLGRIAEERWIRVFMQIVGFIMSALVLYLGFGLLGLSIAWCIQQGSGRLVAALYLRRVMPRLNTKSKVSELPAFFLRMLLPSLKLAVTMVGAVLIFKTDNLIIGSMLSVDDIPPYEAIVRIVIMFSTLSYLLTSSSTPYITRLYSADDLEAIREILLRNARLILGIIGTLVIIFAGFSDFVISIWLGGEHFAGYQVVIFLSILIALEAHHVIHANAMMAAGKLIFHWVALVAGLLNVAISVALATEYGLVGVALGTMIAQLVTMNWYSPYSSLRFFSISLSKYWSESLKPVFGVCAPILVLVLMTREIFPVFDSVYYGLISISVIGFIGVLLICFVVLTASERGILLSFLQSRRSGQHG